MSIKKQKNPEETLRIQRKVKKNNAIGYNIQLSEEQKVAKSKILENKITILTGRAGTGKTLLAIAVGIDLLFKKEIERIFITRPVVTREDIGFLPGGINEKMDPFLIPIYDCLRTVYSNEDEITRFFKEKIIDIAPIAFMRGRTVENAVLIADETQNIDNDGIKMLLTRLGKGGKIILCGDSAQIDLKNKSLSGLNFLTTLCGKIDGLCCIELKDNHRDPIIDEILKHYEIREAEDAKEKLLKTIAFRKTGS